MSFKQQAKQLSPYLGGIAAVAGFIGDVLLPLLNFAPYVAALSLIVFIINVLARKKNWFASQASEGSIVSHLRSDGLLLLSGVSTIIFAFYTALFSIAPPNGYLSSNFEPIAKLQDTLLGVQKTLDEVKETTARTEEMVKQLDQTTSEGFSALQEAFTSLQASNVISPNPTSPQQWYSNAKIFQLRGQTAKALESFEGYFKFDLEFVDPAKEYARLITTTEGINRALMIFNGLSSKYPSNRALMLVENSLLESTKEQISNLEEMIVKHPEFGPFFKALGDNYGREHLRTGTIDLENRQKEAYKKVLQLEKAQNFTRFYISKAVAATELESMQPALDTSSATKEWYVYESYAPNFGSGSYGLQKSIQIVPPEENISELRYSIKEPSLDRTADPQDHAIMITLPARVGDYAIYAQYVDVNGSESEIWKYSFSIPPVILTATPIKNEYDWELDITPVLIEFDLAEGYGSPDGAYFFSIDSDSLDQKLTCENGCRGRGIRLPREEEEQWNPYPLEYWYDAPESAFRSARNMGFSLPQEFWSSAPESALLLAREQGFSPPGNKDPSGEDVIEDMAPFRRGTHTIYAKFVGSNGQESSVSSNKYEIN
jgi:tetratricopeptide (TPR) repeat protein